MGSWGFESDANDNTYNYLGVGVPDRLGGAAVFSEADREDFARDVEKSLNDLIKEIDAPEEGYSLGYLQTAFLGIVRLTLVKRCRVDIEHLNRALSYAKSFLADTDYLEDFTKPKKREQCLQEEIEMIQDAIANDGSTEKGGKTAGLFETIEKNKHLEE